MIRHLMKISPSDDTQLLDKIVQVRAKKQPTSDIRCILDEIIHVK